MRSLVRRIEILESCVAKKREAVARSIKEAVDDFSGYAKAGQIQLLISAFGGERTGRLLTAAEAEVRAQFLERAKHVFQRSRMPLQTTVSPKTVISHAVIYALLDFQDQHRVDLSLQFDGLIAVAEG